MKKFSLILPVYKQAQTIQDNIRIVLESMSAVKYPYELIAVIDGDLDGSRLEASKLRDKHLKIVGYKTNHGKGYAVRYGFSHASGDVIGFIDAGGDLTASYLPLALEQFLWLEADAVIGSKRHPESKVQYPVLRRVLSYGYQLIVRLLFNLNIRDSQVGFKIYKRELLEKVLPRLLVKKFAFDIEILAVAHHLGFTKIREVPVEIDFSRVKSSITSINFWNVVFQTLQDTMAVFYRLKILHYYDDTNNRKWRYDPELNFRVNIG